MAGHRRDDQHARLLGRHSFLKRSSVAKGVESTTSSVTGDGAVAVRDLGDAERKPRMGDGETGESLQHAGEFPHREKLPDVGPGRAQRRARHGGDGPDHV